MNKTMEYSIIIRNIVALHCVLLVIIIIGWNSNFGLNSNIIFVFKWLLLGGGISLFFLVRKPFKFITVYFGFYLVFPLLLVIGIFLLPLLGVVFAVFFYQLMLPPKTVFQQENYKIITLGTNYTRGGELKRTHFYFIEENLGVLPDYFPANTYKNLKINKDNKNVIKSLTTQKKPVIILKLAIVSIMTK